jgi:hypothetical protein
MRTFVALGIVSLFVGAGMVACGDDDTADGPGLGGGGSGGTAGNGGGGSGGMPAGGAAGTGGTGGATGPGSGAGGSGGAPPDIAPLATCTGCVELVAPVVGPRSTDNVADEASYIFPLGAPVDFSDGVITWRIAAVQPNAGYSVVLFAQNGQALNFAGVYSETTLPPAAFPANEFRDISLDVAAIPPAPGDAGVPDASVPPPPPGPVDAGADAGDAGASPVSTPPDVAAGFDKSQIIQIGIFVGVNEGFTGNATVRVAVDQVSITGVPGQVDRTFTANTEGLVINQYNVPPSTPAPILHP